MKLILLFAAVTYVTALGSDRCVWGPSFWCSHVSRAKECRAVNHCMSTVWKKQILKPENSGECMYCQFAFNEVKEILQNKDIQEDISKYVENICNLFPDPDWKSTCDGIVTEDLPILIQMLDNKIQSQMICATIGMCSGLEDKYSPYGVLAGKKGDEQPPNTTCADCTKFFKDVQDSVVSQETQSELEQVINQLVCNNIPSLTSLCQDAVKEILPQLLKFLADQIDPNITCRVFGFCTSTGRVDVIPIKNVFKNLKKPLTYRSSEECEACKDLMQEVVNTLRDGSTQTVVQSDIETYICDNLGVLGTQCKSLVEEYLPMLFELLVNELDPKTVCEFVQLCTVPSGSHLLQTIKAVKVEPALLISDGYRDNSIECNACEFIMQEVDNALKMNKTINVTEDLLKDICNKLPSDDLKQQCLSFVNEYAPMVVELIAQAVNPKEVCTRLGFCAKKLKKDFTDSGLKSSVECDFCVIGIQSLQELIANVSTETITTYAKEACNFLPMNISQTCFKYVDEYLPIAITLLKTTKDPKELCRLGGLCTSTIAHRPYMTKPIPESVGQLTVPEKQDDKVGIPTCEICTVAITYLKNLIKENSSEAEIKEALDKLCDVLPSQYATDCTEFVENYGSAIIEFISKEVGGDVNKICKDLKLCTSILGQTLKLQTGILSPVDTLPIVLGENMKGQDTMKSKDNKVQASQLCEICNTAVIFLKQYLDNNVTEAELEEDLKKFCTTLPDTLQSTCTTLVDMYGKQIVDYLAHNIPDNLCTDIGLCSSGLGKKGQDSIKAEDNKVQASELCELCNTAALFLKQFLDKNATEAELKEELKSLCTDLPDVLQSECTSLVEQYGDQIINYLINSVDPSTICTQIGLCSSGLGKKLISKSGILSPVDSLPILTEENKKGQGSMSSVNSKVEASELCEICNTAMLMVKEILNNNSTEAEIKEEVEKFLCNRLLSSVQSECRSLIDVFGPDIVEYLVKHFDPYHLCTDIGICSSALGTNVMSQSGILSPIDTLPIVSEGGKKAVPAVKGMVECDMCKMVLSAADEALQQKSTQDEIKNYLLDGCKKLPSEIHSECAMLVNKFYMVAINYLLLSQSPATLCEELTFCPSKQECPKMVEGFHKVEDSAECVLCEFVLHEVDGILKKNATEEEIKKVLDDVCGFMPDTIKPECINFVRKYSEIIIALLVKEVDPKSVCTTLGLCSSRSFADLATLVKILPDKSKVGVDECETCELVISTIRDFLRENTTTQEITNYFVGLCSILPDTVTAQCEDVVKQYIPAIIDLIEQDISPKQVCQELGACNATLGIKPMRLLKPSKAVPQKVDTKLYFKSHSKLLGTEKCTYGPAFWCDSYENAKMCNAVEHCQNHVWN